MVHDIESRTFDFSVTLLRFSKTVPRDDTSYIIIKQLIRAGTSIGANVTEGRASASKKDFINFYYHALKSARETIYWLRLLDTTLSQNTHQGSCGKLTEEAGEISRILGKIVVNARKNMRTP